MNVAAAVANLEDLRLEPFAIALVARNEHVGEELHLDAHLAFALAGFASAAGHVEREVAGRQPAGARILRGGEQLTDRIEGFQIRDVLGTRPPPDWLLVG